MPIDFRSNLRRTLAVSLLALTTAGCAARDEAKRETDAGAKAADAYLQLRENVQPYRGPANVRIKDGIWLGDQGRRSSAGDPLPARFEKKNGVTLVSSRPLSLVEIAARITEITGIPVRDAELVGVWGEADNDGPARRSSPNAGPGASNGNGRPMGMLGDAFGTDTSGADRAAGMEIHYAGSLSGLLNLIGSQHDIEWTYRDGVIQFLGPQMRTFTLYALPGETTTTNKLDSAVLGGGEAGSTADSTVSTTNATSGTSSKLTLNYWKNVQATITALLPKGTPFALNPDVGTITVTAKPSILRAVETYVREENRRLARQVAISVKVLSITVDSKDIYNFDIAAVLNGMTDGYGFGFKSVTPFAAAGAAQLTGAILPGNSWKSKKFTGINPSTITGGTVNIDPVTGAVTPGTPGTAAVEASQAMFQALSDQGMASLITSSSVTTLNNQPAPISVLTQQAYVSRSSVSTTGETTAVELDTATVNVGFNMSVLPRIFSNGELVLQYNITLADLIRIQEYISAGTSVQLPEIDSRALMQSVRMQSGDTLVLAGFERARNSVRDQGTGTPTNWFFGGGTNAQNKREMIVLLITPVVLESTKQIETLR